MNSTMITIYQNENSRNAKHEVYSFSVNDDINSFDITIYQNENSRNAKHEVYSFSVNDDMNLEQILFDMAQDLHRKKFININKLHRIFDFNFSTTLSNIAVNLKQPILNLSDNLTFIKEKALGVE